MTLMAVSILSILALVAAALTVAAQTAAFELVKVQPDVQYDSGSGQCIDGRGIFFSFTSFLSPSQWISHDFVKFKNPDQIQKVKLHLSLRKGEKKENDGKTLVKNIKGYKLNIIAQITLKPPTPLKSNRSTPAEPASPAVEPVSTAATLASAARAIGAQLIIAVAVILLVVSILSILALVATALDVAAQTIGAHAATALVTV
ncbi:hypothetical protein Q3G72_010374 [Acer saccharum]|nr:hypothetical protein Q3G72_010374 [Acer saccharum]